MEGERKPQETSAQKDPEPEKVLRRIKISKEEIHQEGIIRFGNRSEKNNPISIFYFFCFYFRLLRN